MADHIAAIKEIVSREVHDGRKLAWLVAEVEAHPIIVADILACLILKVADLEAEVQHLRGSAYRV